MLADAPTDAIAIRGQLREIEQAARRLIVRAAHMEKRAGRLRTDSAERLSLHERARKHRMDAALLLAEVSQLARRLSTT